VCHLLRGEGDVEFVAVDWHGFVFFLLFVFGFSGAGAGARSSGVALVLIRECSCQKSASGRSGGWLGWDGSWGLPWIAWLCRKVDASRCDAVVYALRRTLERRRERQKTSHLKCG